MDETLGWEKLFEEGVALTDAGRPAMALVLFQRILRRSPGHPEVLGALGDAYLKLGAHGKAREACEQALALSPDNLFARLVLARTLYETGDPAGAEADYRFLLTRMPASLDILNELVTILMVQERTPEALETVGLRLREDPCNAHLHFVQGFIHQQRMELEEAVACYDLGLASDPPEATRDRLRWNRGLARLLLGRLDPEAWDARELRGRMGGAAPRPFSQPAWDGSPLAGRTVLLHGEGEGFGDTIMGLHYAAPLRALGGRVLVEVRPELLELVRACPSVDAVVAAGEDLPPHACHAHLMSLPRLFGTGMETIPWAGPYLSVPPGAAHREAIAALACREPGRLNVGLVYAGVTTEGPEAQASLDPSLLGSLGSLVERVRFFSLQRHREPALAPLPAALRATDLGGCLGDFADAACALANMDLLISVDTSMLHLAGAMGVPAAGLLAFVPDWRWLAAGSRSAWYPSLRLYRQRVRRGWPEVMEALERDLAAVLEGGAGGAEGLLDGLKGYPG